MLVRQGQIELLWIASANSGWIYQSESRSWYGYGAKMNFDFNGVDAPNYPGFFKFRLWPTKALIGAHLYWETKKIQGFAPPFTLSN
jgi:hypothetical protein